MKQLLALVRKEFATLFGAPTAYLTLTLVALVTALIFFDHLRLYNQILFLYSSSGMGGSDQTASLGIAPSTMRRWIGNNRLPGAKALAK